VRRHSARKSTLTPVSQENVDGEEEWQICGSVVDEAHHCLAPVVEHGRILVASSGLLAFDETGNLPPEVYRAALEEIFTCFYHGDVREHWGNVLQDVLALALSTRYLEAAYIFGSFIMAKSTPADSDLFLVMSGDFASNLMEGCACLLLDRSRAVMVWGICIYWITARTDRAPFLAAWQLRRDGGSRGIVEVQG
jgi:hypothetical protein